METNVSYISTPLVDLVLSSEFFAPNATFYDCPYDKAEVNDNGAYNFLTRRFVAYKAGYVGVTINYYAEAASGTTHLVEVNKFTAQGVAIGQKKLIQFNNLQATIVGASGISYFYLNILEQLQINYIQISTGTIRLAPDTNRVFFFSLP